MQSEKYSFLSKLILFTIKQKFLVFIVLFAVLFAGFVTAPFDWELGIPRSPVAVDAIPDIGENQQIVFSEWKGRSPQDIEDQITYPLTVQLMGLPGVKTIRSYSYFGFSSIYVIFKEDVEFYWSRSRILEKLSSLSSGTLPVGVEPSLGPDATGLGQVFWYTLEGENEKGEATGGWDLDELRSIQDFYVKYALQGVEGVAEVASAGGMLREYQVDVDPDKLRYYDISLQQVYQAIAASNKDVGARTLEINSVEYVIRSQGSVRNIKDLENAVLTEHENTPIFLNQVANIHLGPAPRRGALDKEGVDVAGGVVVARYGENPLKVIQRVEQKIIDISGGLPEKILEDGTKSKIKIVPFYNRGGLIKETLETLKEALKEEVLITILVLLFMLGHLRSGILISILLPIAVLSCFVFMRLFGVEANVVALSGIVIAIGTMVDMGIILSENIVKHLENARNDESKTDVVFRATKQVAGAIITAVMTTVVSFLPIFTMVEAEGKLFTPLAFTKTFALVSALGLSLFVIPVVAIVFFKKKSNQKRDKPWLLRGILVLATVSLSHSWAPLGVEKGELLNLVFVALLVFGTLFSIRKFIAFYPMILAWCLWHKKVFLLLPLSILLLGGFVWKDIGEEFMPSLDEGTFLFMPTTMPHASFAEAQSQLALIDQLLAAIPEVETAVGKMGRAESALDPAPISMYETVVHYKTEYGLDSNGNRVRQWRDHIRSPDDIWNEMVEAVRIPGVTSAPKLMPIETRLIMLQSGMRAPMGVKIKGPDLETIEAFALQVEKHLKNVKGIKKETVLADRIVGKPYLEFEIGRREAARYGLSIAKVQETLMTALGGRVAGYSVEGRERYPIRLRYLREKRDNLESMKNMLLHTSKGADIPLSKVAKIHFTKGPMTIKSENGFLVAYVVFDKENKFAETEVIEETKKHLEELIAKKEIILPAGVSYDFAGNYQNQLRAQKTLMLVIPITLLLIFLILYLQFKSVWNALMIFSGIAVAWAGGFILIGLYNTDWFLNFVLFGIDFRDLFQIHPVNLSVAVWVGFIALFGIASDDGVVMSEYLKQSFEAKKLHDIKDIHKAIIEAGTRRIKPCMMTTATTLLALLPVLTSDGRGADIMLPMSIPTFGGMLMAITTVFIVPVLYCVKEEIFLKKRQKAMMLKTLEK